MQTLFWKHAPAWVAKLSYSALALVLIYLGAYAALYRFSQAQNLQQHANTLLNGSPYHLTFGQQIERRLFPRPTIVLHNVRLYAPDGHADLLADDVQLGLSWSSIFGQTEIEKLVFNQARGKFYRTAQGKWNVQSWFTPNPDSPSIRINRILLNDSRLTLSIADQELTLEQVQLQAHPSKRGHTFYLNSQLPTSWWQSLHIQAQGEMYSDDDGLHLPDLQANFRGKAQDYTFSGQLNSQIHGQNQQLIAQNTRLSLNSQQYQLNLSATAEQWSHQYDNQQTLVKNLTSTFVATPDGGRYQGTLRTAQTQIDHSQIHSDEMTLNLVHSSLHYSPFTLSLTSRADWHSILGLSLPNFKLTTVQENGNAPRFNSEWEGSLHVQSLHDWQLNAHGLFDRQPANITLRHEPKQLTGDVYLSKLDLNPYVAQDDNLATVLPNYPDWLNQHTPWRLQLNMDNLTLHTASMDNIHTTMLANAKQISFEPMTLDLYGGKSEGSLHILNRSPLQYQLNQKATQVQIQPLLQDLLQHSRLSGQGNAEFHLQSHGNTHTELLQNLAGSLQLDVQDGEWQGVDFTNIIQTLAGNKLPKSSETNNTPFTRFQLRTQIQHGISHHQSQVELLRPIATVVGEGEYQLSENILKEDLLITGKNSPAPLPIRISGAADDPTFSLNYQKITEGLKTPAEKQQAISDTLKQQWQWLKQQSAAQDDSNPPKTK